MGSVFVQDCMKKTSIISPVGSQSTLSLEYVALIEDMARAHLQQLRGCECAVSVCV